MSSIFYQGSNFIGLSRYLKQARVSAGLTQSELARAVGLSRAQITRIETATTRPNVTRLIDILSVLEGMGAN